MGHEKRYDTLPHDLNDRAACLRKTKLRNKANAKGYAARQSRLSGRALYAYHCGYCDGWHITSTAPEVTRARARDRAAAKEAIENLRAPLSDPGPVRRHRGMQRHPDSHLDHHLTPPQVDYLLARFADRAAFFLETVELPEHLGTVPCGLHGPTMGDSPVPEAEVSRAPRGDRAWSSRLVARAPRPVRTVTVIAGPHDGHACILYTAFGGPASPQEPGDIRRQLESLEAQRPALGFRGDEHDQLYAKIVALRVKRDEADAFWGEHALSRDPC